MAMWISGKDLADLTMACAKYLEDLGWVINPPGVGAARQNQSVEIIDNTGAEVQSAVTGATSTPAAQRSAAPGMANAPAAQQSVDDIRRELQRDLVAYSRHAGKDGSVRDLVRSALGSSTPISKATPEQLDLIRQKLTEAGGAA